MGRQNVTGIISENMVKQELIKLGFNVFKPLPDKGVDFIIKESNGSEKELRIQVKGRGPIQTNKRYRWFQIRTTKKIRDQTIELGLPVNEAWRKKVSLVDVYVFVSIRYGEFWIFESKEIENLIRIFRSRCGKRKDNLEGLQAEIDLDIKYENLPLTEIYSENLNNWDIVKNHFC